LSASIVCRMHIANAVAAGELCVCHPAGYQLLELLSAFEVARSNLLRPAGYLSDFAGSPNQQQAAQQLLQHVGNITAPVYANSLLLEGLLYTAAQAVQQLAAAAAAAEAAAMPSRELWLQTTGSSSSSSSSGAGGGALRFVQVQPGLAVAVDAAAQAAAMASDACKLLQQADGTGVEGAASRRLSPETQVTALQAGLSAVDAALNSTIPGSSSSSSSSAAAARLQDAPCTLLQHLMVCRQLLACSWLPPLAAAAAQGCQPTDIARAAIDSSSSSSSPATTKQLLRGALGTLSAVSNSSTSSAAAAPLLLLTEGQAAVLQPLLVEAGLDTCPHKQQRQQQQQRSGNSGSSSSSSSGRSPWVDLSAVSWQAASGGIGCNSTGSSGSSPAVGGTANSSAGQAPQQEATATAAAVDDYSNVAMNGGVPTQVHEGPRGLLLLHDIVSTTEEAQQLLQHWQEEQQQQQQQADGRLAVPAELPLQVLRASADVVQLLLRHHPNAGVRQQLYISGLLPLLELQQQVTVCSHVLQSLAAWLYTAKGEHHNLQCGGLCLQHCALHWCVHTPRHSLLFPAGFGSGPKPQAAASCRAWCRQLR
jgi:hypothetical protein